jgi:phosphotriesterase-related protein
MTGDTEITATVQTARGPIPGDRLGVTLTHEHLFVVDAEYAANYVSQPQVDAILDAATQRLTQAHDAGVETIVDLTVHGIGRMTSWIQRLAKRTPVNLIVSTGAYVNRELPLLWTLRGPGTIMGGPDPMTEIFIRDLVEGIGDSGIRAATLKCVTDVAGVTPAVERTMLAVAAAHVATGAPVFTHSHAASRNGLEQIRLLTDAGVDPSRLVIGHSGDSEDLDYLEQLLAAGCYLGMDRFGSQEPLSRERRIATVVALVRRGWAGRLLLSHDASCYHAWMDEEIVARLAPDSAFTYIPTRVLPELLCKGVAEDEITLMTVSNARRLLAR